LTPSAPRRAGETACGEKPARDDRLDRYGQPNQQTFAFGQANVGHSSRGAEVDWTTVPDGVELEIIETAMRWKNGSVGAAIACGRDGLGALAAT